MAQSRPAVEPAGSPGGQRASLRWQRYRRIVVAALIGYWLLMFAATHVPTIPKEIQPGFSDKWQHYVAYAGLGFLLAASRSFHVRLTWGGCLILWGIAALYGALDEITQPLFGRDAEFLDWRSDVIGAATGLVVAVMAIRTFARKSIQVNDSE